MKRFSHLRRLAQAFSLIEVLVSTVILCVILLVIFGITQETSRVWKNSRAKIEAFQGARAAFDSLTRRLSQATLNGYYDYFDASGKAASELGYDGSPVRYGRQSDLHFLSGRNLLSTPVQVTHAVFFQAPLGYAGGTNWSALDGALNATGYYVTYNDDAESGLRPGFVSATLSPLKHRFRLMQFTQSLQDLGIFKNANTVGTGWLTSGGSPVGNNSSTRPLAENIVALVILPKRADADNPSGLPLSGADFSYDTRTAWSGSNQPVQMNQLPPLLHVAMVAIDEPSAQRLCTGATPPDLGLDVLFQDVEHLEDDLGKLEQTLREKHVKYEIFRADIGIRGAKWSE